MSTHARGERVRCGYVDAGGLQVHFRMVGDTAGSERLVVLLHQTPLSSRHLAPLLPELATVERPKRGHPGAGDGTSVQGRDPEYDWYRDGDGDGTVCE